MGRRIEQRADETDYRIFKLTRSNLPISSRRARALISFTLNPGGVQFLGFTGATIVFETITYVIGYKRVLENGYLGWGLLLFASIAATATAGVIIAIFFMNPNLLASAFGGVMVFSGIHGVGGAIGSVLGVLLIKAMEARNINPL